MANSEIIGAGQDTARRAPKKEYPPVLDVCCSARGFWYDKQDLRAVFCDKRKETIVQSTPSGIRKNGKPYKPWEHRVVPDLLSDFTNLPFPKNVFKMVIFDPPHGFFSESQFMAKQYGTLKNCDWKNMLRRGFSECFRVLIPFGFLIFKWNETSVVLSEIFKLTDEKPLFGHKTGKANKTHWVCFMKQESPVLGEEVPAQNTVEICHTAPNSGRDAMQLDIFDGVQ